MKRRMIITIGISIVVIVVISVISIIVTQRASINTIPKYIDAGEYSKAVKAYNKYVAGDSRKEKELTGTIEKAINDVVEFWSTGEVEAVAAIDALDSFSNIKNTSLSSSAKEYKKFISIESKSDVLFDQAEMIFDNGDYMGALEKLASIDKSYSQYDFVKERFDQCEELLIIQVSNPGSIEEYRECERTIDECLAIAKTPAFVRKKNMLNDERDIFVAAAPSLEKARSEYNNGEYKASFRTLEQAQADDSSNRFINETLEKLHEGFVIDQMLKIRESVGDKDYDAALKRVSDSIEIYNCEDLSIARKYVLEKKYPVYRLTNNITENISSKWRSEKFDVKKASDDGAKYIVRSGKKFALGDYDGDSVTVLSMSGDVATALLGIDLPLDIRDLSYDVTHWGEEDYFVLHVAADTIALIPVVGAVKYLKYSKEVSKGTKAGIRSAKEMVGGSTTAAKETARILERCNDISKNADESAAISRVLFKKYDRVKTGCQNYVGRVYPGTNVRIVTNRIIYSDGRKIEGAFPVFESKDEYQLPRELYKSSEKVQKRWLREHMKNLAAQGKLDSKFSKRELEAIKEGRVPNGYVWHHNEKEGLMQLVDEATHNAVPHTGGMFLWGKGYGNRAAEKAVA